MLLQPAQDADGMAFAPGLHLLGVPIPGDHLKGICVFDSLNLGGGLVLLALRSRVDALGHQGAGLGTALPGLLEAYVGPQAEDDPLFPAVDPVLHAPGFAARGQDFQEEAAPIGQLESLVLGLGIFHGNVGQGEDFFGHGGSSPFPRNSSPLHIADEIFKGYAKLRADAPNAEFYGGISPDVSPKTLAVNGRNRTKPDYL